MAEIADCPPADPVFAARVKHYRRVIARGKLGHRPTLAQQMAIDRAAQLEAEVDHVFADPASTANDRVRAVNAARLMRLRMEAVLQAKREEVEEFGL